ncbi:hypothetical protein LIER_35049 [Lithospermum erythrorhizon]|uniref:ATP-dependent DNA helicase n=1 Tax=Lithospermum erythrorhizon TaxID=34254 RepID=A0AAV3NMC5_LITER
MAEDFVRIKNQMHLSENDVLQKVLQGINDTLESLGRDINEFKLVSFQYVPNEYEKLTRDIASEKNIPVSDEHLRGIHKLNSQQKIAFDTIYSAAMSDSGGVFFVDGPGGTGKSFLYTILLAHIRSKGYIALIVASSGIASSNFLGGRTSHSRFKIPIDIEPSIQCQISFQRSEADIIRSSKIIIWDEAPMTNKLVVEALDKLLQDLCENKTPFGGKLIVFGGNFRQVLPVVRGGGRREQVQTSLVSSYLWPYFTKVKLTENMRARDDPGFIDYLLRTRNGEEPTNSKGQVKLPDPMIIPYTNLEDSFEALISYVYPDMNLFESSPFEMMRMSILCPKNEFFVDGIKSKLIERLPREEVIYTNLKKNSPVILLRNINPVQRLCNGTRLICKNLTPNLVGAVIATRQFKGKHVWIPRIPLEPNPSDNKYLIPFVRRQVPLRLCFAMSINKAQGQTLDYVGLYLKQPVFTHGQLYVAISRAKIGNNVIVLILPPTTRDIGTKYTTNVVYDEVLLRASFS